MSSSLSMVEGMLPPGFRFHPRDDELVLDYLSRKLGGGGAATVDYGCPTMVDVDLNKVEPWDLPEFACIGGKEWYFYSLRDKKYATGQRTNRATESGYWKATGKDRTISRKGTLVGMRKTLVFYQGRAPKGKKTEWVMHEFRKEGQGVQVKLPFKEDWVLCRVFYKSRATTAKPPTGSSSSYSIDSAAAPSLPPLIDNYIAFDHPGMAAAVQNLLEGYEQVPCFSSNPSHPPPAPPRLPAAPTMADVHHQEQQQQHMGKAIKDALVSHLARLDQGGVKREVPPPQQQQQEEEEDVFAQQDGFGYLAESGFSQLWNSLS